MKKAKGVPLLWLGLALVAASAGRGDVGALVAGVLLLRLSLATLARRALRA